MYLLHYYIIITIYHSYYSNSYYYYYCYSPPQINSPHSLYLLHYPHPPLLYTSPSLSHLMVSSYYSILSHHYNNLIKILSTLSSPSMSLNVLEAIPTSYAHSPYPFYAHYAIYVHYAIYANYVIYANLTIYTYYQLHVYSIITIFVYVIIVIIISVLYLMANYYIYPLNSNFFKLPPYFFT